MRQFGSPVSFLFFFFNNNNIKEEEEEEQELRKVSFTAAAAVGRRVEIPRRVLTPDEFAQKLRRKNKKKARNKRRVSNRMPKLILVFSKKKKIFNRPKNASSCKK
jgi:hypothetical protein